MVFRGRPSKACQRCRERRLRCDLKKPGCNSCVRGGVLCEGYRDANVIRFTDQTESVRSKAIAREKAGQLQGCTGSFEICHLTQDLQVLGRDMFFGTYVFDFSRTWDFLCPYLDSTTTPDHLAAGIDAVSLAFLSHQVSSPTAKEMARLKYAEALRKINKAIQDPESAKQMSTFQGALLLDLFEKITVSDTSEATATRHAHVDGALALITLRGIQNFRPGPELKALLSFSLNATIRALSTSTPIPSLVHQIRAHAHHFVDTSYPKWKLNECILAVTGLPDETRNRNLSQRERIARSVTLDMRLATVAAEASPSWSYERKFISAYDARVSLPDGLGMYDVYPNRMVTQGYNVLRLVRILVCEEIIGLCETLNDDDGVESERARLVIVDMAREICASVPQMTNCEGAARGKVVVQGGMHTHTHKHTQSHVLDVYVMIFGLYIVAWSRNCPVSYSVWAVGQLRYIAEHFVIREAAVVLGMLRAPEGRDRHESWERGPWCVYKLLGGHAFAAS